MEKSIQNNISVWTLLGVALLLGAFGLGLILSNYGGGFSLSNIFLMVLPLAICGIICMISKRPLLWCSWVASTGYWIYFFLLSYHWEENYLMLVLGILLVAVALVYTIMLSRRGEIDVPAWVWGVLALVLAAAGVLLYINLIPPMEGTVTQPFPIE